MTINAGQGGLKVPNLTRTDPRVDKKPLGAEGGLRRRPLGQGFGYLPDDAVRDLPAEELRLAAAYVTRRAPDLLEVLGLPERRPLVELEEAS